MIKTTLKYSGQGYRRPIEMEFYLVSARKKRKKPLHQNENRRLGHFAAIDPLKATV